MTHRDFPREVRADAEVRLRLARDDDAALIAEWTRETAVHRHWGGRPLTVEEALQKYTGQRAPDVISYVICVDGRPAGYMQAWQRDGGCGLDMFVAAHEQGRGVGPRAARALAEELIAAGWVGLTVDPDRDDVNAIAAWHRAGFRATDDVSGPVAAGQQLMLFDPSA